MTTELHILAARIHSEMSDIAVVVDRAQVAWQRAELGHDELYLDSVALNLHGFYSGVERVFELIAARVDEFTPRGSDWHQELLRQMSSEVPKIRPPVISTETMTQLDQYRAFRHVVRNVYTFVLDPVRIGLLVKDLTNTFGRLEEELGQFLDFLQGCTRSMGM